VRAGARLARRTEGGEPRMPEVELLGGAGEELGVLGNGAGPPTLDVADPELVEQRRDGELVRHGEVHPLLLRAVAQGRVVDVDGELTLRGEPRRRAHGSRSLAPAVAVLLPDGGGAGSRRRRGGPATKKPPGVREVAHVAGWVPRALADNEPELHGHMMTHECRDRDHRPGGGPVRRAGASSRGGPRRGRTGCR